MKAVLIFPVCRLLVLVPEISVLQASWYDTSSMSENRTSIPRAAATSTVFLLNSSDPFSRTVPAAAVAEASQFLDRRLIALSSSWPTSITIGSAGVAAGAVVAVWAWAKGTVRTSAMLRRKQRCRLSRSISCDVQLTKQTEAYDITAWLGTNYRDRTNYRFSDMMRQIVGLTPPTRMNRCAYQSKLEIQLSCLTIQ